MSPSDLRDAKMFGAFSDLTHDDREDLAREATVRNTLRRVEKALAEGHVKTPMFVPELLGDKDYIKTLQRLVVYAVRGYLSEHRRPADLWDIYRRVREYVDRFIRDGDWPKEWRVPSKRTIDRRVNEVASANSLENHVMQQGKPPLIATRAGEYAPNPALFEDVAKILEA